MKKLILVIIVVIVAAGLYFVSRRPAPTSQEPIKIGVVASMSGPGAFYGQNIRKGVDLAAKEINDAGGIDGRPLQVIYEDDQTNPTKTVSAVQKFINVDNVVAIIGPQWDFLANAGIPVAQEAKVVLISTAAPFDSIIGENQRSPYFFTTYPSVNSNNESIKGFFGRENVQTAVIIAVNNDWGTAHVNAYQTVADEIGVKILKVFRLAQTDNNDIRTELTQIRQLNLDAILLSLNDADNINFVRRYRELNLKARVLANANFPDPLYTERLEQKTAQGFYFFEFTAPSQLFVEAFQKQYNEAPQVSADTSYDAIYVLKTAIEKGDAAREGILRGLKTIKAFRGAAGPIDFTMNNYPNNKQSILKRVTETDFEIIN